MELFRELLPLGGEVMDEPWVIRQRAEPDIQRQRLQQSAIVERRIDQCNGETALDAELFRERFFRISGHPLAQKAMGLTMLRVFHPGCW